MSVTARLETLTLPTYPVGVPERNPVFFEKRVYQGSCGKVYPVPFIDRVYDEPSPVNYRSARIENELVRLVLLPEIGGRLFRGQDKTNRDYDFFYRQDVIKPALVGLAGPWISGGVEFNWPQHHRPGTFLPADVFIEEEPDGACTIWMSEHDPLSRLKGMHGIRLRPGSALIELRVRLYNRTPFTQTFLWWTNIAARAHDRYQSFFPPDVHYVADHAVRAQSSFPFANGPYYGVRYQDRPGANDLTWYRNIPVPTSYMICESALGFFGGYDHEAQGGFVHVANRHIAPGKKQWTWGNHAFGYAWDRELTDKGGPYVELMCGVYTDNQPDFSYLAPYETRVFSQFWWPIQQIGTVQAANERAALRLVVGDDKRIEIGIVVPTVLTRTRILLTENDRVLLDTHADLHPGVSFRYCERHLTGNRTDALWLRLIDTAGTEVISYRPVVIDPTQRRRPVATEPPAPADIKSTDELFIVGEHLEQYRHPTRDPEAYWCEALRRDPRDLRCNLGLGRRMLRRGKFAEAAAHLEMAIARLTERHPNPATGEAHYYLGLVRRWQNRGDEAYALLYKATWSYEWRAASYYELAALDCQRGDFVIALAHLEASLDTNRQSNKTHVLRAAVLRRLGRVASAKEVLDTLIAVDPLDHWARHEQALLTGDSTRFLELCRNDAQTILDLAFDYSDAGLFTEAIALIDQHIAHPVAPTAVPNPLGRTPSTRYALAWLKGRQKEPVDTITKKLADARGQASDYFFPSRLHEQVILEWAIAQNGPDPLASFALGNYYFDLKRHEDAIVAWEESSAGGAAFATVHRNLGIAYWNVRRDGARAQVAYERALALDPTDARLVFEFDQLRKKRNEAPSARFSFLELHRVLIAQRDDASVELAALYNLLDRPADALALLAARRFHPWEGGEGAVLRQYTAARVRLGQQALANGDAIGAKAHFELATAAPPNLGEAFHLLRAKADVNYWLGRACQALDLEVEATRHFEASAGEATGAPGMTTTVCSSLSYYSGCSLRELGRMAEALQLFAELRGFAERSIGQVAQIDYFATSLPNLLVFEEDLQAQRDAEGHLLAALGAYGLGDVSAAEQHLELTLATSCSDLRAVELARWLAAKPRIT